MSRAQTGRRVDSPGCWVGRWGWRWCRWRWSPHKGWRVPLGSLCQTGLWPGVPPVPVFLFVALWKPLHSSCRRETGSLNPPADGYRGARRGAERLTWFLSYIPCSRGAGDRSVLCHRRESRRPGLWSDLAPVTQTLGGELRLRHKQFVPKPRVLACSVDDTVTAENGLRQEERQSSALTSLSPHGLKHLRFKRPSSRESKLTFEIAETPGTPRNAPMRTHTPAPSRSRAQCGPPVRATQMRNF